MLRDPDQAEQWDVIETPTLVRVAPEPHRKIVGGLRDPARLALALERITDDDGPSG